jgi:uncharacterized membrane protein
MNKYEFAVRWLHVIAGITWIGMLYFFNFVNVPLQADLDDAGKKAANPKLQPRALWWFRWGAMVTFFAGLLLYAMVYMYIPEIGFVSQGLRMPSGWLVMGMLFGTIMWFNVWFIIWPIQKKILSGKATPEELPAIRRKAYLASRTNTYLSAPMLLGMLAANHLNAAFTLGRAVIALALAFAAIWVAIFHSYKVGKTV